MGILGALDPYKHQVRIACNRVSCVTNSGVASRRASARSQAARRFQSANRYFADDDGVNAL
jgi:hypothetical protein